jgi:hypothetical protein
LFATVMSLSGKRLACDCGCALHMFWHSLSLSTKEGNGQGVHAF